MLRNGGSPPPASLSHAALLPDTCRRDTHHRAANHRPTADVLPTNQQPSRSSRYAGLCPLLKPTSRPSRPARKQRPYEKCRLAKDAVASINRWATRDPTGRTKVQSPYIHEMDHEPNFIYAGLIGGQDVMTASKGDKDDATAKGDKAIKGDKIAISGRAADNVPIPMPRPTF